MATGVPGLDRVWFAMFWRDEPPVAFETLARRTRPNDSLAAPAGLCRAARPDFDAPSLPRPVSQLFADIARVAMSEPNTRELHIGPASDRRRFAQLSPLMRFPDVVDVQVVDLGGGHASLALYSRALVGIRDFGVNRARIARWLDAVAA